MRRRLVPLLILAVLATGAPVPGGAVAGFGDVGAADYWARPVQWMVDEGITTGTSAACFSPDDPVTRGQLAAFMWRMAGEPTPGGSHPFGDVVKDWQDEPVAWLVEAGVTHGTSPTHYSPEDNLTRGQVAAMLHRLAGEPAAGGHPFGDVVKDWQQVAVAWMVERQITTGTSAVTYDPEATVTRGQVATFFHRYNGSPEVTLDSSSPVCGASGDGDGAGDVTPPPPPAPDCTVRADEPWSPVWFDIHYNDGPSQCARPDFEGDGATYIVDRDHPAASDTNPGTAALPWRTLTHADGQIAPGDIVYVKRGTYDDGRMELTTDGVIVSAYPGHERQVILRGAGIRGIGTADVIIHGFHVRESTSHGLQFMGPGVRNVVIANNHTYDTRHSGINLRGFHQSADPGDWDGIQDALVIGNLVQLGTNGGISEVISVGSGAVRVDVAANELSIGDFEHNAGDEGISFKEGVRDSRIYGNDIHDLSDKGIHIDGGSFDWDAQITNIEIFDNRLYNLPAPGMWVVTEGMGDVDGVYVHHNWAWNNDGDGFLVYDHPDGRAAGGTVRNVVFEHNVAFNNGEHVGYGGFRVNHDTTSGIVFRDNIAWNNNGYGIRGEAETTIESNLCPDAVCEINAAPRFVAAPGDFTLRADSPAVGAASDGTDLGPG